MGKIMASSLVVFLVVCFALSDGVKGGWNLTREEDEELDRQLKIINKPSIMTFRNEDGDIIDCVDINKQPAFDHPLLKNHSIEGTPTSYPSGDNDDNVTSVSHYEAVLRSKKCPPGTIPIRRTTKDDLIRLRSFSKLGGEYIFSAPHLKYGSPSGGHWAILMCNKGKYHGSNARLARYRISGVGNDQYSGTTMSLMGGADGPPDTFNVIMAGWLVHPSLYGDAHARFTIFWTTDGYHRVKCYNHLCPGFIQKSDKYNLGFIVDDHLERQFEVFIYQMEDNGHWWLEVDDGESRETIGYWPKYQFNSLDGHADYVQLGGSVMSPVNKKSPPMGNGHFPSNDDGGLISYIQVIDEENQRKLPVGELIADKPDCYKTNKNLAHTKDLQVFFRYGGPGGCLG